MLFKSVVPFDREMPTFVSSGSDRGPVRSLFKVSEAESRMDPEWIRFKMDRTRNFRSTSNVLFKIWLTLLFLCVLVAAGGGGWAWETEENPVLRIRIYYSR
jgi:hypothetical protein